MNIQLLPSNDGAGGESELNIGEILQSVKDRWYWFVIPAMVSLCLGFLYLKRVSPVYQRSATVLIKDEHSGGHMSELAIINELTHMNLKSNTGNEILVFKSHSLMSETVRRLSLDVNYAIPEGLHMVDLHTKTPVTFDFPEVGETHSFRLKATLLADHKVRLSRFESPGGKSNQEATVQMNDTVHTAFGTLIITPTLWYGDDWLGKTITVEKRNRNAIVGHYRNALKVALTDKQSSVLQLTLQDGSISRAEDILNTLITVYNEEAINDKNTVSLNTEKFINERLAVIEEDLENVDRQIESFKRGNQLTDIQSDVQLLLQENAEYGHIGTDLRNQYAMVNHVRSYLADPSKSMELIPAHTGIEDGGIEAQISAYNQQLLKRNRLIESSSSSNPVVQDLNMSLTAQRQNIMRAMDNLQTNLTIRNRNASARERQAKDRIASVPLQQKELTSIERHQKIKSELYLYLLNKREENAINKSITENPVRVIDTAIGSNAPIAPNAGKILLPAFLAGLLLPAGLLYLFSITDVYVRTRRDLHKLTVPFLGEIPRHMNKKAGWDIPVAGALLRRHAWLRQTKRPPGAAVQEGSHTPVSEAFRMIHTHMEFMLEKDRKQKVLMTSSSDAGSGKSFIALNLALSLAIAGRKALLVDMDIRKRGVSKGMNKQGQGGLSSYLAGRTSIDGIIEKGDFMHPNLDFLFSGPEPPNPAELLLSNRLDVLFDELRKIYDYIVVDSVPAGMVADCMIANRVADMTLFVVRAGKTLKRTLPEAEQLYKNGRLRHMAVLLNCVDSD